jgi:hypothetical protein
MLSPYAVVILTLNEVKGKDPFRSSRILQSFPPAKALCGGQVTPSE